ncbi:MAG: hypothetical protein AAGA03_14610 [Planctomycetota bacterium]
MSDQGVIQCVQDSLRELIADCHAWQNWQGNTWTREQALAHLYHDALPPPPPKQEAYTIQQLEKLRPFAIISTQAFDGYQVDIDAEFDFRASGSLHLCIEQDRPADLDKDPAEVDRQAKENIGKLIYSDDPATPGIVNLAQNRMRLTRISVSGPLLPDPEELKEYGDRCQWIQLAINWRF